MTQNQGWKEKLKRNIFKMQVTSYINQTRIKFIFDFATTKKIVYAWFIRNYFIYVFIY